MARTAFRAALSELEIDETDRVSDMKEAIDDEDVAPECPRWRSDQRCSAPPAVVVGCGGLVASAGATRLLRLRRSALLESGLLPPPSSNPSPTPWLRLAAI